MAKQSAGKAKRTLKPKAKMRTVGKTKWNTKDSVFTHLFSFPEYQLELYKALHPDDQDVSEADIKTITRDCVVAKHEHNDLGILIKDRLMVFVEAQSSWSPNIVIRLMSYAVQSLMDYFRERDVYLFSSTKAECPRIELYAIFSCERENMPETLSLCGEFFRGADAIWMRPFIFFISTRGKRISSTSTSCSVGFLMIRLKNMAIRPRRSAKHFASAAMKAYSPNISKKWRVRSWIS